MLSLKYDESVYHPFPPHSLLVIKIISINHNSSADLPLILRVTVRVSMIKVESRYFITKNNKSNHRQSERQGKVRGGQADLNVICQPG